MCGILSVGVRHCFVMFALDCQICCISHSACAVAFFRDFQLGQFPLEAPVTACGDLRLWLCGSHQVRHSGRWSLRFFENMS